MNKQALLKICMGVCILLTLAGCHPYTKQIPTGPAFKADNVYTNPSYDYKKLTNVTLLPVVNPLDNRMVNLYHKMLATTTLRNFTKFKYFNIHFDPDTKVKTDTLINLDTNQIDRAAIGALGDKLNTQAMLQLTVTDLQVFPPMHISVKAALIDVENGERIWAFDSVFDTEDANVMNALRMWWNTHMAGGDHFNRFDIQKLNPSFFLNYVFYTMAESFGESRIKDVKNIAELKKSMTKNS